MGKVEIFQDKALAWRYRVRARNGEILSTSEAYVSKWNAQRGWRALRQAVTTAGEPICL